MTDIGDISGMGAAALRELAATPRAFRSVQGALLWYVEALAAKTGRSASMESGGVPRAQEKIDEGHATWACIAKCLVMYDEEIDLDPPPMPANWKTCQVLWERRLERLLTYYSSRESQQQRAADESGFDGLAEFSRNCADTEDKIARRMRARGLIGVRP